MKIKFIVGKLKVYFEINRATFKLIDELIMRSRQLNANFVC
ncbi:hypothetical protein BCAH1134_C0511 (plasmid) [Bacillus cereus AH1134]|nr:hypothetical protein BCAH1134_C0511 [Bacillus cereus AH1134]